MAKESKIKETKDVKEVKEVKETTLAEKAKAKKDAATKAKEAAKASQTETAAAAPAKTTKKTSAPKENCFIEFSGEQISVADITENAKKLWKAENNDALSQINVYINIDHRKAYYVVNNEDRGEFEF